MHLSKTTRFLIAAILLCLLHLPGWTQGPDITVKGTVLSDKGLPIEGASISIAGSEKGAISNTQGVFTLMAPVGSTLVITYVGYDTAHVLAQATVQVRLKPTAGSLTDVIVIGYGTQQRKDL